jgi:ATP-dependent Clp protease ATP-binding subunit ClpA
VGSQFIAGFAGRGDAAGAAAYEEMKAQVIESLRLQFRPEFLNRVDEIIVFHALTDADLVAIVDLLLADLSRRLAAQDLTLELTPSARALIAREGNDPAYGARPLKRTIQRLVENSFARALLQGQFKAGDRIVGDADAIGGTIVFSAGDTSVAVDATERRDARGASGGTPVGAGAGKGRRSPLDLPDIDAKPDKERPDLVN